MKSAYLKVVCILSCIFLLCVATVHGGCLADADTSHTSADYNQRLFSYASKQPVQPSTSNELKFMTFNLQSGYHYNCVNNVTIQADFMRGMDYVGNQEVVQGVDTRCNRCNIPQTIADRAGMATRFVMAIPYRTGQYGTNVGTSQTILDTKWGLLSYSGVEARGIIAVKTQPLALKGKYLWFVNIHIEYYVDTIRYSQMADILTFINTNILAYDPEAVIVMTGDFNGGPWDTSVYNVLKAASFKNTWEVFSGTIEGGNTISAFDPGSRFDHIWYRAPTSVKVTVKNAEVPAVLLSDHRPVVATLSFDVASASSSSSSSSGSTSTSGSTSSSGGNGGCSPVQEAAPAASIVCVGPITEGNAVTIKCPVASQTITSVDFASYGNPTGSCQNFKLGNCVGGASMAVTKDKCLNRSSCTFPIANNVFGDPCPGNGKHFVAQVTCK